MTTIPKEKRVKPPHGIAFLIEPNDDGKVVKALAFLDGESWRVQFSAVEEAPDPLRLAFLLTAKANLLALATEAQGGAWPKPLVGPQQERPLLFHWDDPDHKLWEDVGEEWRQFASKIEGRFKDIPLDVKIKLRSLFPKHGKAIKGRQKPLVALAARMSSENLLVTFLSLYNRLMNRPQGALPAIGEVLFADILRRSAITSADATADIMQQILLSRYAAQHQDRWWLHYMAAIWSAQLDHFIPLETRLVIDPSFREPEIPDRFDSPLSLIQLVQQNEHLVLIGPSGVGKSWLLSQMAKDWASLRAPSADCLPIVVKLSDFNLIQDIHGLITETICEHIGENHRGTIKEWLHSEESQSATVLFLLDGYNEILPPNRQRFDRLLQSFLKARSNRVVISSHEYDSARICPDWSRVVIGELSRNNIERYLVSRLGHRGHLFSARINASPEFAPLTRSPFYLNAIAKYAQLRNIDDVPSSQVDLISVIVEDAVARKRGEVAEFGTHVAFTEVEHFLSAVAHQILVLHRKRPLRHPQDTTPLWPDPAVHVRNVLEFAELLGILSSSGTTAGSGTKRAEVRFAHDIIRDYFAAHYLFNKFLDDEKAFLRDIQNHYLEDMIWDEAILLLADLCKAEAACAELIELLLRHATTLGSEFVFRLPQVSETLLVATARLVARSSNYHTGRFPAPVRPAKLLARLPESRLQSLYRKLPTETYAWLCVAYAYAFRSDDSWKHLFPLREDCAAPALEIILNALARIGTFEAFLHAVPLIRKVIGSEEYRHYLTISHAQLFGDNYFILSPDQLLDFLRDPNNRGISDPLAGHLAHLTFDLKHVARLTRLASSESFEIQSGAVDALAKVDPRTAMAVLEHELQSPFMRFWYVQSEKWFARLLCRLARSGETDSVFAIVEEELASLGGVVPRQAQILLQVLAYIQTDTAAEIVFWHLVESDVAIPLGVISAFAANQHFLELLHMRRKRSSKRVRARVALALAALGDTAASAELSEIIRMGLSESDDGKASRMSRTTIMALRTVAVRGDQRLAPMIWRLIEKIKDPICKRAAIRTLAELGYHSVLWLIVQGAVTDDVNAAGDLAAEAISDVGKNELRQIVLRLRDIADSPGGVGVEGRAYVTSISRRILMQVGWRFPDLQGWPCGLEAFSAYPEPTGFDEMECLMRDGNL